LTDQRLGVQIHCLRHEVARGLEATLDGIAALGLGAVEMVSLPGCRGNRWGDFGVAADRPARELGAALRAAGLECPSTMVYLPELVPGRRQATYQWVSELGCPRIVLTMLATGTTPTGPPPTRADWQRAFDGFAPLAGSMRAAGLEPVVHTQPDLWRRIGDWLPADELPLRARADDYRVEFDPTGLMIHGGDALASLRAFLDTLYALHLRDGSTPPEPTFYIPALPLGEGGFDWPACLRAAAGVQPWRFLEMETSDPADTWAALRSSVDYLRGLDLA
jgi:sugar phosphate isomerase/epimerase